MTPREITVGDPVELILRVHTPDGAEVIWPPKDAFDPAEVYTTDTLKTSSEERAIRYTISVFEPGDNELPDLPVVLKTESKIDTFWIDPGIIEVKSIIDPADSLGLKDIKPPHALAFSWREVLPYAAAAAVLLLAGGLAYFFWRRWKKAKGELTAPPPPPPPPYSTAKRRLEDLRIRKLWQNGYIKEYYSELTEILKHYIDGRFGIDAPEMTSEELFDLQDKWSIDEKTYRFIEKIVTCADLTKFAKFTPGKEDHIDCMDSAFAYLEATKPEIDVPVIKIEDSKVDEMIREEQTAEAEK